MTTYAELVTQIRGYTETDDQVLTSTIVNDFIEHAEHRIFRDVELQDSNVYVNGNTAANNRFVRLPGYSATDPTKPTISDLTNIRYVTIYLDSGNKQRSELVRVDQDFMNEYYDTPEAGQSDKPKYYANWDNDTIILAPTPNAAYTIELAYNALPTGLSSSNTTTWVSNNTPQLLLYACLVEAFMFLKAPDMLNIYALKYKEEVQTLGQEQMGRRRRDEYMDGVPRIPIQSNNP